MKHFVLVKASAPFACCAAALCLVLTAGCGGGGGKKSSPSASSSASASLTSATGRAKLTIKWPAPSTTRLVPDLSNSIVVEILRGTDRTVFAAKIVARPDDVSVPSVVTFDSLPVETLTLRASAHPNPDGTGTAQAASETPLLIADGQETNFGTLTMGTTIDTITAAPPANGGTVLAGSGGQQWTATAKDAAGNIVLVSLDKQLWESSDTSVATVDPKTGVVTPSAVNTTSGTTVIKETDTESGKSGTASLTVSPVGSIVVTVPTISAAAKSVLVTAGSASKLLPRVNGETSLSATFASQIPGSYPITAAAYATTDGTGVAVSKGSATTTIGASGGDVSVSVPLVSEISGLSISPNAVTLALNTTQPFTVQAVNAAGETVPTVASQFTWASDAAAVVSIDAASGLAKANTTGTATLTVREVESGKSASAPVTVAHVPDSVGPAQFNPNNSSYANTLSNGSGSPFVGDWSVTSGSYRFDTGANPPTLTNTTTSTVIAKGKLVTQTFGAARTTVTYAVFDFPGNVSITKSTISATGANPLVLLTQGNFSLNGSGGSAALSVSSGVAGGATAGTGPGAGLLSGLYGGGSFGGAGGGPTNGVYGTDFTSHLQGGSGGAVGTRSASGGGAVYVGAVGTLTVTSASISATGGSIGTLSGSVSGGGGSGGGIALWGSGGVTFSSATIFANGGGVRGGFPDNIFRPAANGYGGGGGYVVVGYGPGMAAPSLSTVFVNAGVHSGPGTGGSGSPGVKSAVSFAGF